MTTNWLWVGPLLCLFFSHIMHPFILYPFSLIHNYNFYLNLSFFFNSLSFFFNSLSFFFNSLSFYYAFLFSFIMHSDRQLILNFELWVEIFCVLTCFHMRIPNSCLSVRPSVCTARKEIALDSSISVLQELLIHQWKGLHEYLPITACKHNTEI